MRFITIADYCLLPTLPPVLPTLPQSCQFNAILSKLDRGANGVTFYLGHDADVSERVGE